MVALRRHFARFGPGRADSPGGRPALPRRAIFACGPGATGNNAPCDGPSPCPAGPRRSDDALLILAITSSPRRGGNSETMLDAAVEGARAAGAGVEKVALGELGFRPCLNCGGCHRTGRCVQRDAYAALNDRLRAADRLILATPIFFGSMCAQLKCLVDRGQPFWAEKYLLKKPPEPRALERRGLLLACGGFSKGEQFLANAQQIVSIYLTCLDMRPAGAVFQPGVDEKGAILRHPEALERCRAAGAALARP